MAVGVYGPADGPAVIYGKPNLNHVGPQRANSKIQRSRPDSDFPDDSDLMSPRDLEVITKYSTWSWMQNAMPNTYDSLDKLLLPEAGWMATDAGLKYLGRRVRGDQYLAKETWDALIGQREELLSRAMETPYWDSEEEKIFESSVPVGEELLKKHKTVSRRERDKDSFEAKACEAYGLKKSQEWISRLSCDETDTLRWFSANGSSIIRNPEAYPDDDEFPVDTLMDALEKAPKTGFPLRLYRGVKKEHIGGNVDSVGNEFTVDVQELPVSTSVNESTGKGFAKDALLILDVEEADYGFLSAMSSWGCSEQEVVLDGSARFKVDRIEESERGRYQIIHASEIRSTH